MLSVYLTNNLRKVSLFFNTQFHMNLYKLTLFPFVLFSPQSNGLATNLLLFIQQCTCLTGTILILTEIFMTL